MEDEQLVPLYEALESQERTIRLFRMANERSTNLPSTSELLRILAFSVGRIVFEPWVPSWFLPKQSIRGELEAFPLGKAPPYHALSYVWGDSKITEAIKIGKHSVEVTTNLLAALRRLHLEYDTEYLWIDAICINQKDDDEKSEQVPMMGDIYKGAQTVLMWLGEEQPHTTRAFSIIRKCSASMTYLDQIQAPQTPNEPWNSSAVAFLLGHSRSLGSQKTTIALSKLFSNPYWERVWIFQEVANSKGAIMLSGRHRLDFFDLFMASSLWYLTSVMSYQHTGGAPLDECGAIETFEAFRNITMGTPGRGAQFNSSIEANGSDEAKNKVARAVWNHFTPPNDNIFELFEKTRWCKATDPRDRFYALLNLLPANKVFMKPNYRMKADEVYRTLVIEGIRSTCSLSCISFGGVGVYAREDPACRPSWIPDFMRLGDSKLPRATTIYTREFAGRLAADASGGTAPVYRISPDMTRLLAEGFVCGTVVSVVQNSIQPPFVEEIATFLGMYDLRVGQGTELYWQLFRVLLPLEVYQAKTSDFASVQSPETVNAQLQDGTNVLASGFMFYLGLLSYKNYFQAKINTMEKARWLPLRDMEQAKIALGEGNPALSYFHLACNSSRWFWAEDRDLLEKLYQQACQVFESFPDSPTFKRPTLIDWRITGRLSVNVATIRFFKAAGYAWANRSFVVTKEGYMGFARPGTQVGDKVCILHGCSVPLMVRPAGAEYVLVGDSYFYGMMKGEMLEKQEAGQFVLETLAIK